MPTVKTVDDYIELEPVNADVRLSYDSDIEQFGDLYLPENTSNPFPVIVLLHGGCWRSAHSLLQLGKLSQSLVSLGYAVWNLEYRRLGNGGGWPTTFIDVAKGTDYLREISSQYNLDPTRLITMGHSAGGHLALWLAVRDQLPKSSELYTKNPVSVSNVISLAGIPDLENGVKQNICRGACEELMGGPPEKYPDRYKQGSPHHFSMKSIPSIHLLGELDPIVPLDYLRSSIQQQPDNLEIIPNVGHFEMVMPETIAWTYIKRSLETLRNNTN